MLGDLVFSETRLLASELSSPVKLYVRLYYVLKMLIAELDRSLRFLETRYWDILMSFYADEIRGDRASAEKLRSELESMRSIAEEYLYVRSLLSSVSLIMEEASPEDLMGPWSIFALTRGVVEEARVSGMKVSAMLAVELAGVRDLLDLLLSGRSLGGKVDVEGITSRARNETQAELGKRFPRPFSLSQDLSSLA